MTGGFFFLFLAFFPLCYFIEGPCQIVGAFFFSSFLSFFFSFDFFLRFFCLRVRTQKNSHTLRLCSFVLVRCLSPPSGLGLQEASKRSLRQHPRYSRNTHPGAAATKWAPLRTISAAPSIYMQHSGAVVSREGLIGMQIKNNNQPDRICMCIWTTIQHMQPAGAGRSQQQQKQQQLYSSSQHQQAE